MFCQGSAGVREIRHARHDTGGWGGGVGVGKQAVIGVEWRWMAVTKEITGGLSPGPWIVLLSAFSAKLYIQFPSSQLAVHRCT